VKYYLVRADLSEDVKPVFTAPQQLIEHLNRRGYKVEVIREATDEDIRSLVLLELDVSEILSEHYEGGKTMRVRVFILNLPFDSKVYEELGRVVHFLARSNAQIKYADGEGIVFEMPETEEIFGVEVDNRKTIEEFIKSLNLERIRVDIE